MKVLIIEDEAPAARRLSSLLAQINPKISILDTIDSMEASVKWFKNHQAPELIFMDVQLADFYAEQKTVLSMSKKNIQWITLWTN